MKSATTSTLPVPFVGTLCRVEQPRMPAETAISVGKGLLIIPVSIEAAIDAESAHLIANEIASEIPVLGITKNVGDRIEKILEIHRPENILDMKCFGLQQHEQTLYSLLGKFYDLTLTNINGELKLATTRDGEEGAEMIIDSVSYSSIRNTLAKLLSVQELPEELESAREEIALLIGTDKALEIKNRYECIAMGSSCIIATSFWERVKERAEELGGKIGYTMHHHPVLPLMVAAERERPKQLYEYTLQSSVDDTKFHRSNGVPYFEIRAFGSLTAPGDPKAGVMRMFYESDTDSCAGPFFRASAIR